jgi:hypothetical protein
VADISDAEFIGAIVITLLLWWKAWWNIRYYLALKQDGATFEGFALARTYVAIRREYKRDKKEWIREQERRRKGNQ